MNRVLHGRHNRSKAFVGAWSAKREVRDISIMQGGSGGTPGRSCRNFTQRHHCCAPTQCCHGMTSSHAYHWCLRLSHRVCFWPALVRSDSELAQSQHALHLEVPAFHTGTFVLACGADVDTAHGSRLPTWCEQALAIKCLQAGRASHLQVSTQADRGASRTIRRCCMRCCAAVARPWPHACVLSAGRWPVAPPPSPGGR